jgi:hypothetical protein
MKAIQAIKTIDCFSLPVSKTVNFQGNSYHRTLYGAAFTVIAFMLIIIFGSKKFEEMNSKERP